MTILKLLGVILIMAAVAAYNEYLQAQRWHRNEQNIYRKYVPKEIQAEIEKYDFFTNRL